MAHFIQMKKKLKEEILLALDKAKMLDYTKTLASFSLSTGFKEDTIKKVLEQMKELDYIVIDENIIRRPTAKPTPGAQQ